MIEFKSENIIEALQNGLGKEGDLTIVITCTKCDALFELNPESATMAIGLNIPFIEYLRWVQNSKCPQCNKAEE